MSTEAEPGYTPLLEAAHGCHAVEAVKALLPFLDAEDVAAMDEEGKTAAQVLEGVQGAEGVVTQLQALDTLKATSTEGSKRSHPGTC